VSEVTAFLTLGNIQSLQLWIGMNIKSKRDLAINQVPITTKHPQTKVCHKNKSPAAKQKGPGD
jgi:hypothetical protein